jgi:hypothetical protein
VDDPSGKQLVREIKFQIYLPRSVSIGTSETTTINRHYSWKKKQDSQLFYKPLTRA